MEGFCIFCNEIQDLKESHIYPKFVIDYTKKTGSKYLRNFIQPNKRQQDGVKAYLLCEKAEQEFSKREKWFSENIFREYLDNQVKNFKYKEDLFYFAISFLWRVLVLHLKEPKIIQGSHNTLLNHVSLEWQKFLRNQEYPQNFDRIYLFFTDRVKSHNIDAKGVDYYMTRTLDGTIVGNQEGTFVAVYGKFSRFVFWGLIKGGDETKLNDLKINPMSGELKIPQKFEEPSMVGFFENRIKGIASLVGPTSAQQQKIANEILKDKNSFFKSDAGQAISNDKLNLDSKS